MKLKLIISILLWLIIGASVFNKLSNNESGLTGASVNTVESIKPFVLTKEEQEERLGYLLSAQRNIYECERDYRETEGSIIEDTSVFGRGAKVVYCKSGRDKEGYVVKGLIKKDRIYNTKNKWLNDTMHNWYIRPCIRIKRDLIYPLVQGFNEENWHTKICRLEIVNMQGKVIKEVEYEGKDFWERHPDDECMIYYSGSYRDRKNHLTTIDSIITITGKELNPNGKMNVNANKLDYRIYWYGYTDMWVDYIKVENETSVDLLSGNNDMWLTAMNGITAEWIDKAPPRNEGNKICYNYLYNNLKIIARK